MTATEEISQGLITGTAAAYVQAFEMITGHSFTPDLTSGTVLERIRTRLAPLFIDTLASPKARH